MGMLYLAGDGFNLWGRGTESNAYVDEDTRLSSSPDMPAPYLVANVHDGFPSQMARFGSDLASSTLTLYLQQLKAGELDDWTAGAPDEWTEVVGGAGTVVEDAAIKVAGSSAKCSCTAAVGTYGSFYQHVSVRPGEQSRVSVNLRGDAAGGGDSALFSVINLNTGKYLQSDGSWASSGTLWTRNVAAFAENVLDFTVESFAACNYEQWVQLRILCSSIVSTGAARDAWFDRIRLFPLVNFASIHGHNLGGAGKTVQLRGSTDGFVGSDDLIATLTNASPTMFAKHATMQTYRDYRVQIDGAQDSTLLGNKYFGEVVLGQAGTLSQNPKMGSVAVQRSAPQMRSPDAFGEQRVYQLGVTPQRSLTLPFGHFSDSDFEEFYYEFVVRSGFGAHPSVVALDSANARDAVYGRLANDYGLRFGDLDTWRDSVAVVDELPFPTVIS